MALYRVKIVGISNHWLLPPISFSSFNHSPLFPGNLSCFVSYPASSICYLSLIKQACTFRCHAGFGTSKLIHSALKYSQKWVNIWSTSNTRDYLKVYEVPQSRNHHILHYQREKYPTSSHPTAILTHSTRHFHPIQYTNPAASIGPSPYLTKDYPAQPIPTFPNSHQSENIYPLAHPRHHFLPLPPYSSTSPTSSATLCYQARPTRNTATSSYTLTAQERRRGELQHCLHQYGLHHSAALVAPLSGFITFRSTSRRNNFTSFISSFLSSFLTSSARNLSTSSSTTRNSTTMSTLAQEKEKFTPPADLPAKYASEEVHRYMIDCMTAVGTPKPHAQALADVLVAADTRGHYSHGLNRLEMYVNDVHQSVCAGGAVPTIIKESVSTALVNGNNGLGPVVGNFCVDLAVKKAKETGIGWVCARGSNHYGIAGWYAMRATEKGMLGMSFTNTSPLVAPTRAKKAALGTNPIAMSAPAKNGDDFVLDMATCVVAVGKIEVERRKEKPLPEGWAIGKDGQPTTDSAEGKIGALMPLGGPELHSGYKGYGLGMLVEVLCGIMSGGQYGPNVRRWMETDREADLGQCFVAIDPTFFAPGFEDRMSDLMGYCRNMEPADESKPVLAAGDPERAHMDKVKKEGGITYHINQIKDSWKLAKALGVKPME